MQNKKIQFLVLFLATLAFLFSAQSVYAASPTGYHDTVDNSSCTTGGWAYDPDSSSSSINVDIYRDGQAGGSGVSLGRYSANVYRSDVNSSMKISGNHGFSIDLSSKLNDGKSHTLYVYPIDYNTGQGNPSNPLKNTPRTITCAAPAPTLSVSVTPTSINKGESVTVSWTTTNATSCTGSRGGSYSTGGSFVGTPSSLPYTYGFTCTGSGGTVTKSVTVTQKASPAPILIFSANSTAITNGQTVTLSWSSSNATSCTASNGWSGNKSTSGSQSVTPSTTATYTLTCTGSGGDIVKSVVIAVNASTTNQAPTGYHDGVDNSSCATSGWAYDPDSSSSSINVDIYRDGPAGGSGVSLGRYSANVYRSDVNSAMKISGNHGFSVNLASYLTDGKSHTLYIYPIDYNTGSGNPSNALTGTPQIITCVAAPEAPAQLHVPGGTDGPVNKFAGDQVTIHWGVANVTSWKITGPGFSKNGGVVGNTPQYNSASFTPPSPANGVAGADYIYTIIGTGSEVIDSILVTVKNQQCNDGKDNDGDGNIDYPSDGGCSSANDNDESGGGGGSSPTPTPSLNVVLTASPSSGVAPFSTSLTATTSGTAKGIIDYRFTCNNVAGDVFTLSNADTTRSVTCSYPTENSYVPSVRITREGVTVSDTTVINVLAGSTPPMFDFFDIFVPSSPQCNDGIDNDGDGKTDYPSDPGCSGANDNDEADPLAPLIVEFIPVPIITTTFSCSVPLYADPASIARSQSTTLKWDCPEATSCILNGGSITNATVSATGARTVTPLDTTTYTLLCTDGSGDQGCLDADVSCPAEVQVSGVKIIEVIPNE
ncbi:MAG: hypothetical protein V1652_00140 [bacterium]